MPNISKIKEIYLRTFKPKTVKVTCTNCSKSFKVDGKDFKFENMYEVECPYCNEEGIITEAEVTKWILSRGGILPRPERKIPQPFIGDHMFLLGYNINWRNRTGNFKEQIYIYKQFDGKIKGVNHKTKVAYTECYEFSGYVKRGAYSGKTRKIIKEANKPISISLKKEIESLERIKAKDG